MRIFRNISSELYYKALDIMIPTLDIKLLDSYKNKRTLFIYFDYEREYRGHEINITDKNIKHILLLLDKYDFKSTWFTVGKVISKYPQSISEILDKEHEIGSHTYSHVSPFATSSRELSNDFKMLEQAAVKIDTISGFHSPKGQWAFKTYKFLRQYGFTYEIVGSREDRHLNPVSFKYGYKKQIFRFKTIGDDWSLYKSSYTKMEVLDYFIQLTKRTQRGQIAGIGFHPWLLFSNENFILGFELFLEFLHDNKDLHIESLKFIRDKNQLS